MDVAVAVGAALLGVLIAESMEALRLYRIGSEGSPNRWPKNLRFSQYATVSAIRLALAGLVTVALMVLGLLCDESLAFLAGLSTLKVVETLFGYSPAT